MFQIKVILLLSLSLQSICLLVIAQANIKKPFIEHLSNSPCIDKIQDGSAFASIRLFNPTQSEEPSVVEIPVGNIATPGLVDWQNTRLVYKGRDLPFSIREGQAHWRAALIAPVKKPRAEDLLVFQISVPIGQWAKVELVTGVSKSQASLTERDGYDVITYPNIKVTINERTGLLTNLEAYGESLLNHPLGLRFFKVGEWVVNYEGRMEALVGFQHPPLMELLKSGDLGSPVVKLVSWSSTEALTELNFVLHSKNVPAIDLTYRIYSNNQLEILSDERPWQGTSPWLDYGLEYKLTLAGRQEKLHDYQTYFPMYGYKDYATSVNSIGTLYHGTKTRMFELGEESLNGRFWRRLVAIYPETERVQKEDPLTLLDEGLIVTVTPMLSQRLPQKLSVVYAKEIRSTGDLVVDSLKKAGIEATTASEPDNHSRSIILLNLVKGRVPSLNNE